MSHDPRRSPAKKHPARSGPSSARTTRPTAASQPKPQPQPKPAEPLNEQELGELEALLDALPAPLEPLDLSMLDGYLVGVLLQPKQVPAFRWTPHVLDAEEGRSPPEGFDTRPLLALVKRRYSELNQAIVERQWFDPLVFELDDADSPSEVVLPWVAGFALAAELFPELMQQKAAELLEPLASLYMHLDPDDLEDADELLEEIETLEPPADVAEAVESLVRSTLLLADITRPQPARHAAPPARRGPPQRKRY
ncbi:YecA family protein [Roseateles violae]|uniref:YecA family protein n=1 Tax=Roseateles violae TaxID=3058042 RepID=A0ABT8DLR9_9BURK|nr:YecA family protein [Pelomonas sp. PFR6]MDN3919345.1 YecA family protein [Pelomonas sp. PFR6]